MREPFGRVLVGVLAVQFFEFVEFLQHEFSVFADPVDVVRATDVGIPSQFIVCTAEVLFVAGTVDQGRPSGHTYLDSDYSSASSP